MAIIPILLAQLDVLWRNPPGNLSRLQGHLVDIEGDEDSLLVLPEMLSTGFTDNLSDLAEVAGGPWETSLVNGLDIPAVLGIARRQHDGTITNEAVYLQPSRAEHVAYRKILPIRSEHKVVTAGCEVITFDHQGVRFCPLICYDLRFPELFRAGLRQGAEVFLVIASWPAPRHHHWELLLQVIAPLGEILYHAGESESVTRVEIDAQRVRDWRAEFPGTKDYLDQPSPA